MKTESYRDPLCGYSTTVLTKIDDRELRAAVDGDSVLMQLRTRIIEELAAKIIARLEPAIEAGIAGIGDALNEKACVVPQRYVLAESYGRYVAWLLRTKTSNHEAIYLDGLPFKGDRIAPGCLIKLDNWHLNPSYTLSVRRSLLDCATPEDWSKEDVAKGLDLCPPSP